MEPGVLIFLLYLMIAHELVCGLMQYRRQAAKPHKQLMWGSSAPVCPGTWRVTSQPVHTRRREKYGRIVRKV